MFETVVIGVDGRPGGRDAIALAVRLAAPEARLILANVHSDGGAVGYGASQSIAQARARAEQVLSSERAKLGERADTIVVYSGSPGRALQDLAEREAVDLLVVGSCHRSALGRVLLGDDAWAALDRAPCALAIAPRGYAAAERPLRRIGVGYDHSSESERALDVARALRGDTSATIRAREVVSLQALPTTGSIPMDWTLQTERVMADERARMATIDDVQGEVVYGDPGEELEALAGDVDLLIVGSRGQGPIGRLLEGSTSAYLARHVTAPLLVLPRSSSSEAVSPTS
ncbi:MAG TPA: universal stress protein [Solirubrobacteraceae bacterium]|jgi:nucleotide-binding universal stress UspA family protein